MQSLPVPLLLLVFVVAAAVVWWAGVRLTNATDTLDKRLGWGDAFGGLILLAIVISLPDVAVVSTAAITGDIGLATGSILGGAAVQVVVLTVLDIKGRNTGVPLTSRTRTLTPALEALMVIAALTLVLLGSHLEPMSYFRIEPTALLIFLTWMAGLLVVRKANPSPAWEPNRSDDQAPPETPGQKDDRSTRKIVGTFLFAAALTLAGGVALEQSGAAIATQLGIDPIVFGATVLAVATSVPDISPGMQAVKLGNHELAISDAFGAVAFLPSLLLVIAVVSGQAVLPFTENIPLYLAALGIFLMCIFVVGLVLRSRRTVFRMGVDTLVAITVYCIGLVGLIVVL